MDVRLCASPGVSEPGARSAPRSTVLGVNLLRPSDDPATAVEQLRRWWAEPRPMDLVIETSGSTGEPKRVVLSRDAVRASVLASAARLGASGAWLLALPSAYVAGVQVIARSLQAGHAPILVEESFAASVARAREALPGVPLFTSLVPTQLHRALADAGEREALAQLHTVLVGGARIEESLRQRAAEAGIRCVATYGASETAGGCVYDGMPLDGVRADIDATGRIRLGGPTIFSGYDGDPELTRRTLVDGWYLTSDAGRLDEDGRLSVLGRVDDVAVSGGVNVPLPAVAARLSAHPEVEWAEVLAVPDEEWGQRVVAVIVGHVGVAEARDWVADAHPRSWAPRDVVCVQAMPLLGNGKVDRAALRDLATQG